MEKIRKRYPHPQKAPRKGEEDGGQPRAYCVGGACVLASSLGWDEGDVFPDYEEIANALCDLNPTMPLCVARFHAFDIILYNDTGHFKRAWNVVDKILRITAWPLLSRMGGAA